MLAFAATATSSARALSLRLPTTRDDLPAADSTPPRRHGRHRCRPRLHVPRCAAVVLLAVTACCLVATLRYGPSRAPPPPLPLDKGMHAIAEWQEALPGNALPPPGAGTRYIRYLNENWGVGFNNQLQEIILHAHLAHLSNRTYVLPPLNFPGSDAWHPLAAFVRGALAGSPAPSATHALRAVTRDHFHRACPEWHSAPPANYTALAARLSPEFADTPHAPLEASAEYATLMAEEVDALLALEANPAGDALLDGWTRVLRALPQRCVTVSAASKHIFDYFFFGSDRVQSLLPALLRAPVLRDLQWSTLVHAAAQRNLGAWGWLPPAPANGTEEDDTFAPLPRILALHLRRGDYAQHCEGLSAWGSTFLGVNDAYVLPAERDEDLARTPKTPAQRAAFARHCWPELDDIVARVQRVRAEWDARHPSPPPARPDRLYVLTNGDGAWYAALRARLAPAGWDVRGSPDADFAAPAAPARGRGAARAASERVVAQAVDMALAVRAGVFIGNGFSSLTANVNLLRGAVGRAGRESVGFW